MWKHYWAIVKYSRAFVCSSSLPHLSCPGPLAGGVWRLVGVCSTVPPASCSSANTSILPHTAGRPQQWHTTWFHVKVSRFDSKIKNSKWESHSSSFLQYLVVAFMGIACQNWGALPRCQSKVRLVTVLPCEADEQDPDWKLLDHR